MKKYFHAADDEALRNGTYLVEFRGKTQNAVMRYSLGDFQGYADNRLIPAGLKQYTAKEAAAIRKALR